MTFILTPAFAKKLQIVNCIGALLSQLGVAAYADEDSSVAQLQGLSIDELANIQVYSVSKASQPVNSAPAAVYVITHDEIMRSGATTLPEILRLAPNLQVAQIGAGNYAITARRFNGNAADKLLDLIDGRSVYTPLYGGVLWDEKDVLPENIERIEIISGPGATLWGANAANGIINIITRKAAETNGGVLDVGAGTRQEKASLEYGGALSDTLNYRLYGEGFKYWSDQTSAGAKALDGWSKSQGGLRLDWTDGADLATLEGDLYGGSEGTGSSVSQDIWGGNIQGTWQHDLGEGSSLQLLSYYDATRRYSGIYGYSLDTYDLELQHSFTFGDWNAIVWGVGGRINRDNFNLTGAVQFVPPITSVNLADIFAQDSISLSDELELIVGLKIESDPYTSIEPLPNLRLSWQLNSQTLVWAAVSRAVRAPTRFDVDLRDTLAPSVLILTGDRDFQPEQLTSYELGTRVRVTKAANFSVSTFYDRYDDLRSVEWANMTTQPFLWT